MKHVLMLMTLLLVVAGGVLPGEAQENGANQAQLLVTAIDENGVEQVYRIDPVSGDFEQLSEAEFSVEAFDVSENVLAYASGDLLHIEHAGGELIQKLARPQELLVTVHISPDEQEVSYNDDTGLYILNIESAETKLLLEHKDFTDSNNPNGVGDGRYYYEAQFLEGSDNLSIGVGLWEGRTIGVYDRATETLTELIVGWTEPDVDLQVFNRILLLDDNQVLLHNYDGRGCFPCGLWRAPSIDDIQDYEQVVENEDLTMEVASDIIAPGIPTMVQRPDGIVLLFVQYGVLDETETFQNVTRVAEFDPEAGTLTPVMDAFADDMVLAQPVFSPEGAYLAFIGSPISDNTYTPYGSPVVYDMESSSQLELDFPLEISSIRWME